MAGTRNKAKLDEVRDEEGRRRFHGAFTGGFSAGFYNSVGSKEGWQPKTWQSSRGSRAAQHAQRPEDFMDDEDGLLGRELEAQLPYDTLEEQTRRLVRDQAGRQAQGAAIPGLEAVDELLAPTGVAIGKKLLQLMGWKEGLGVGSRQMRKQQQRAPAEEGEGAEEEQMDDAAFLPEHLRAQAAERGLVQQGRIAFARRDVESFALPTAKDDLYGLGFDPDKHAPEFAALREAARARDDRGVYRMGDVKGQASSSRAGPRDATGFALDDSEDDVYDADAPLALLRMEVGAGPGGKAARYDTVLRGLEEEEEEKEEEAAGRRRGKDAGAAHRMALEEWIGGAGEVSSKGKGPSRCPTDSRPVPDGFVLGVQQWAFKQAFWAPPTPPRSFVPFHRFEEEEQAKHSAAVAGQREAHRGRLVASARGTLLGESKPEPPPGGGSVFDLMSEADRGRLLGKAQAVASSSGTEGDGGGAGVSLAAQVAGGPVGVFQGMQGALAKRFSVVEAPKTATSLQEGLIEKSALGGIAPAVAPAPPLPNPLREPMRSQALWYPAALLCKRFGVPVPQHAKLTPVANAGAGGLPRGGMQPLPPGAAAPASGSLLSNKFEQEMSALIPGGDLLAQVQQAGEGLVEVEEEPVAAAAVEEAALPTFESKPRPTKDFFKAIFEASDSEEEEEEEEEEESDGGEEGDGKDKAAAAGVVKPEMGEERPAPKPAAGGAKKAEAVGKGGGGGGGSSSLPRDHFLQPAVAGGESIEEILAKGPVLIRRKKRLAAAAAVDGGGEDEEDEEEGLVFGAAVIKKQPKKRPKPTTASSSTSAAPTPASASAGATPPTLWGGDETPPPGSTLMMARAAELPPTPPPLAVRVEEAKAFAAPPAPSALMQSSIKQGGGDGSSSGGSSSDEDKGGSAAAKGAAAETAASSRERDRSSRHKKEKKRRKESSRKDSKKSSKKHRMEERKRHREGYSSEDGSSRRRHKKSKHHRH